MLSRMRNGAGTGTAAGTAAGKARMILMVRSNSLTKVVFSNSFGARSKPTPEQLEHLEQKTALEDVKSLCPGNVSHCKGQVRVQFNSDHQYGPIFQIPSLIDPKSNFANKLGFYGSDGCHILTYMLTNVAIVLLLRLILLLLILLLSSVTTLNK